MLAPEGYKIIAITTVVSLLLALCGLLVNSSWGLYLCIPLAVFLLVFVLYFFRDPVRMPPVGAEMMVLAPADGKIVEMVNEHEPLFIEGPVTRISIFLSPLNVHVNRIPASGVVRSVRYVPGDYLVAWEPKASERNERSEIGMVHTTGVPILFKQIAGFVARRIVFHVRENDVVDAGDRFGIVKFGSRMDVCLPVDLVPEVAVGDPVKGGLTILARIPAS